MSGQPSGGGGGGGQPLSTYNPGGFNPYGGAGFGGGYPFGGWGNYGGMFSPFQNWGGQSGYPGSGYRTSPFYNFASGQQSFLSPSITSPYMQNAWNQNPQTIFGAYSPAAFQQFPFFYGVPPGAPTNYLQPSWQQPGWGGSGLGSGGAQMLLKPPGGGMPIDTAILQGNQQSLLGDAGMPPMQPA